MAGGPVYTQRDDAAIARAVKAGARKVGDFRPLAQALGRSATTLRQRAIRIGLIPKGERPGSAPKAPKASRTPKAKPGAPFSAKEDGFLMRAHRRGFDVRDIAFALDRPWPVVENRLQELVADKDPPAAVVVEVEARPDPQAQACERHAAACLAAGGFWSFSERRIGRGKWAVCLPLVPPVQLQGAPR